MMLLLKTGILLCLLNLCLSFELYQWVPEYLLDWIPLWTRCYINNPHDVRNAVHRNISVHLFGQPLVYPLLDHIMMHLSNPKGPLLISLNGPQGVGKNLFTGILAHHIYSEGFSSPYVAYFSGTKDLKDYWDAERIKRIMEKSVKYCSGVFIFDEVDSLPDGILENFKPYFSNRVNNYDFSDSIFLFISNIGADKIIDAAKLKCSDVLFKSTFKLHDFSDVLKEENSNSKGGFKGTTIISDGLVNLFIPFFPLDENEVKLCIVVSANRQKIPFTSELEKFVLNEIPFFNEDGCKFSVYGCKGVDQSVARSKYNV